LAKSDDKIEELHQEKTEVVVGAQEIIKINLLCLSDTQQEWSNYTDSMGPVTFSKVEEVKKAYAEALKRGVKIRIITEVTKHNKDYCKEGMKYVSELRHMDGISGTFVVSDKHYLSNIVAENIGSFQCIHSNVSSFVQQQKHIFENLWNNAIPAIEKIRELEGCDSIEFSKTLEDSREIQTLFLDLIKSAREEVLVLFSSAYRLLQYVESGLLELLVDAIRKRKIHVRILLPVDCQNYPIMKINTEFETKLNDKEHLQNDTIKDGVAARKGNVTTKTIDKNYKSQFLNRTSFILIVDSKIYLLGAIKDQQNTNEEDNQIVNDNQIEFCTFSNNEGAILSNTSIFEILWENAKCN
jgi:hypothetical protein